MSRMHELLKESLSDGMSIPEPLERAWAWMEERGWGSDMGGQYHLTPYPGERQLGVVFVSNGSLDGWFEPGDPAQERLLPIAEISGSGSLAALWLDDDGAVRFVALDSMGSSYVLADSAVDFLRLTAIGYEEIVGWFLALPPESDEAVEAHREFRTWVEETFDVEVPERWFKVSDPDPFAAWLESVKA
ncbi:hypothetical protein LKO27_03225 [Tessaracoccus sp. OS52]|uniref:hypothetical protein n=1 Tax=Tessaracoccus sp. OS52 TaxID=2886691 RepID=UPI001D1026FF|nr:hypothetical protein [Tessaracoccus sp. OS52]MCC2592434.1 hypothetical protein [Tessaracoccus sp. OS52]